MDGGHPKMTISNISLRAAKRCGKVMRMTSFPLNSRLSAGIMPSRPRVAAFAQRCEGNGDTYQVVVLTS